MSNDAAWVRRGPLELRADPARVVSRLFLPGQETPAFGISRADAVIQRVLAMTDDEVSRTLGATLARFADRHRDLRATLAEHFALVEHRLPGSGGVSAERRNLIGAYFTQEYSVEAAALFNPSLVAHPDQSGLAADEVRFVMSVRAVGEGHISSIEFRTGVHSAGGGVRIENPGQHLAAGRAAPAMMSREVLRETLADHADAATTADVLGRLPDVFTTAELEAALAPLERDKLTPDSSEPIIERIRWIVACNYSVHFAGDRPLSECVLVPVGPDESHGVEDARFTRFVDDDGSITYFATYTAYDGSHVAPHLLHTDDFKTFEVRQLTGPAAKNKGMALFPRRVGGTYVALSRWDRESIGIADSRDGIAWGRAVTVQSPERPWELIQLGNCGSPLETCEGWIVLTHGVGPMRTYGIGAILLDLDDPTKMIGALDEPMLTPTEEERDGYVPNVVYSCGAMIHEQTMVLPYGCSDSSVRIAFVDVPELLARLTGSEL